MARAPSLLLGHHLLGPLLLLLPLLLLPGGRVAEGAACVWMAFVQALYDAASLCARDANAGGDASVDAATGDPGYVSPVDVAAALWFGRHDPSSSASASDEGGGNDDDNGSLYAWSRGETMLF